MSDDLEAIRAKRMAELQANQVFVVHITLQIASS